MKKLMAVLAMAAGVAFGGYEAVELTPTQAYNRGAAKVVAMKVVSTDADAVVSAYEVREIASYTNAQLVTSWAVTNVTLRPNREGVYVRGMFNYTNATGTAYVNTEIDDMVKWDKIANGWYIVTNICNGASVTNTAYTQTTNVFTVGGKTYDWSFVELMPTAVTNIVAYTTTNKVTALKEKVTVTNKIATVNCVNGFGMAAPTNTFITGGTLTTSGLDISGEAVKATLIIKK